MQYLKNIIDRVFLDLLAPRTCVVCTRPLALQQNEGVCDQCAPPLMLRVEPWCSRCGAEQHSFDFTTQGESEFNTEGICDTCRSGRMQVRYLRSVYKYAGVLEPLLRSFKYRNRRRLSDYLAAELHQALEPRHPRYGHLPRRRDSSLFPVHDWDILVCVPSSSSSLRQRGYSHMTLVAHRLSQLLRLQAPPLALRSPGERERQVTLRIVQRGRNVRDKFQADSSVFQGRSVLLIDDIITTGASMMASAQAIRAAGATAVDGLSIARSLQFERYRIESS